MSESGNHRRHLGPQPYLKPFTLHAALCFNAGDVACLSAAILQAIREGQITEAGMRSHWQSSPLPTPPRSRHHGLSLPDVQESPCQGSPPSEILSAPRANTTTSVTLFSRSAAAARKPAEPVPGTRTTTLPRRACISESKMPLLKGNQEGRER